MAAAPTTSSVVQESMQQMKQGLAVWLTQLGAGEVSREFFDLIKHIGEAKSKQEEALIIEKQSKKLKEQITKNEIKPDGTDSRLLREMLVRLMYCEMLGTPVPFGYMTALNLTQVKSRLIDKRIGYICAALFLYPSHPMTTLCVNSFRRDLESTNQVEVDMALAAMTQLLNADAVPPVFQFVLKALEHSSPSVRKKAVTVLKKVIEIDDSYVKDIREPLRKALCDIDPSVMAASLNVYSMLVDKEPQVYKDLVPSLVSILKQVIEHALSREYDYHKVPAPWVQIKILKILARLGTSDKKASEHMYEVINETMKRADIGNSAGSAVVYECVSTITKIFPNNTLMDAAAENIARFIANKDHNLKYLGLKSLREIVNINPAYALNHQREVLECLYDPDETIQRTTLDLLFTMTNPNNVTVVVEKLIEQLRTTSDKYFKGDIVKKITDLADRFSPDNQWFINTMNKVFLLGGSLVESSVAYNLITILGEGATGGADEEADRELRIFAVNAYFSIVEKYSVVSDILTQIIAWVLGEYSYLVGREEEAINVMVDLMEKPHEDQYIRVWIMNGLSKLSAQTGLYPPHLQEVVEKYKASSNVELQQRCHELEILCSDKQLLNSMFPVDSSCVDVGATADLSFLDDWINRQVMNRLVPATKYQPQSVVKKRRRKSEVKLNYVYKAPDGALNLSGSSTSTKIQPSIFNDIPAVTPSTVQETSVSSLGGVSGPWGTGGWGAAKKAQAEVSLTVASVAASTAATTTGPWGAPTAEPDKRTASVSAPVNKHDQTLFKLDVTGTKRGDVRRPPRGGGGRASTAVGGTTRPSSIDDANTGNTGGSGGYGSIYDTPITGDGLFSGTQVTKPDPQTPRTQSVSHPNTAHSSVHSGAQSALHTAHPPVQDVSPPAQVYLLDLGSATSTARPVAPIGITSLLDLSTPSTQIVTPTQITSTGVTYIYQNSPSQNFDLPNLQQVGPIAQKIAGKPIFPAVNQSLHEDDQLRVSYVKVFEPNTTSLALFTSNKSAGELAEIQYTFTCPSALKFTLPTDGTHVHTDTNSASTLKTRVKQLPTGATTVLVSENSLGNWEFNLTTTVALSYSVEERVQYARFQVPIVATDFIRPHVLPIQTYGQHWKSFPRTVSHAIPTKTITTAEIYRKMVSDANFGVIDVKGFEVVSCARALPVSGTSIGTAANPSGQPELILLYGKIAQGQLTISLKAQNQAVIDVVGNALKLLFSNK